MTGVIPSSVPADSINIASATFNSGLFELEFYWQPTYSRWFVSIRAYGNMTVRAVKMERGTVSTLLNDSIPNYETELLRCQRYFIRIEIGSYSSLFGMGFVVNSTTAAFHIQTPAQMYKNPSATLTGSLTLFESGTISPSGRIVSSISAYKASQGLRLLVTSATSMTTNNNAMLYTSAYNPIIDLSADIV